MGLMKNFFNRNNIKNETTEAEKRPVYTLSQFFKAYTTMLDREPTFLNCIKYRSEALGKMPIKLIRKDSNGVSEQTNNNLYYLLFTRPNRNEDATSFWNNIEKDRLIFGTSYVYIQRDNKGNVIALKRLNPQLMQVPCVTDPYFLNDTLAYIYQSTKGAIKMTSEDLLIFRNTVLKPNQIEGESSIALLRTILESNAYGNIAINNINKNGIHSSVKVSVDETIDNDRATEIIENAIEQARGVNSTGVIFQEAGVNIEAFNVKLNDADYLNIYKNNQCIILSFFGLSANMLNIEQTTGTYQNSEVQMLQFLTNTMLYVLEMYINELNYKLLTSSQIKKGYTFSFDTTGILKVDFKTLVETQSELVSNAVITVDEARKAVGYNSLANEVGNTCLVNGSYTKLEDVGIAYQKDVSTSEGGGKLEDNRIQEQN